MSSFRRLVAVVLMPCLVLSGCARTLERRLVQPDESSTLDAQSPFLKVHGRDGRTWVLSNWSVDESARLVLGTGRLLDAHRQSIETGRFEIPLDGVVLFETNVARTHGSVAALAVLTGISVAITIACASNPKACFGSCPTFYVADGEEQVLVAEGFSSSIAPSLEQSDIDALHAVRAPRGMLEVAMRNEALETHVVRHVDLLAVQRGVRGRVFATSDGTFWQAERVLEPIACSAVEGDILDAVRATDGYERFSSTDSTNLAQRETLEIEYAHVEPGQYGLVIASRQSLVSTYLLYQTLAYMGRSAGEYIAQLARGDPWIRERLKATGRALGTIEVLVQNADGAWGVAGHTAETGPLATDVRIVPLPATPASTTLRLRLRMTRGYWRIDALHLARLDKRVQPLRLHPAMVTRDGVEDHEAHARLVDSQRTLVTLPGDEYVLGYALPEEPARYELFLESRGYYLEWMRQEWLAEESPEWAAQMFLDPAKALRRLAPQFKKVEAEMEAMFWGSSYGGKKLGTTADVR